MLLGDPGQGKTFAIGTLARHPYVRKLFYLYTDPGGDESLMDSLKHYEVPVDKVHFSYVPPAAEGWDALEALISKVSQMDFESVSKLKQGINKREYRQFMVVVSKLGNFVCDRTGESFGPVDKMPDDCAVVFDSLTGLNQIAKETTVGSKPSLHQGEWGMAMNMEESFIRSFASSISGPKVMIGHLDKTTNQLTGTTEFQVALLGNKLAPKIPHLFSDVIYATRRKGQFVWSTDDDRVSLKARNFPISSTLTPDFGPGLDKWRDRVERFRSTGSPQGVDAE